MTALLLALLFAQVATAPRTPGTVAGQVGMRDGQAPSGIRVALLETSVPAGPAPGPAAIAGFATTDPAGRYRIEGVPPGRYFIAAGYLESPSYYPGVSNPGDARAIEVGVGATIAGLDFTLTRPVGVKVSGRIRGMPAGATGVRVVLDPAGLTPRIEMDTPALGDGTFQFPRVPPGEYLVRLNPGTVDGPVWIQVDDADIQVELQATRLLLGRVTVEDGAKLPVQGTAIVNGAPAVLSFQMRAGRVGGSRVSSVAVAQTNGTLLFTNMDGEYKVSVTMLPFGYWVKTMSYGEVDLIRDTLRLPSNPSLPREVIQVVLTTKAPDTTSNGVTVQGRLPESVFDSVSGPRWVTLQAKTGTPSSGHVGEAPVASDGMFVIHHVPPGTYVARIISAGNSSVAATTFVVADQDVTDVVLTPPLPLPPGLSIAIP